MASRVRGNWSPGESGLQPRVAARNRDGFRSGLASCLRSRFRGRCPPCLRAALTRLPSPTWPRCPALADWKHQALWYKSGWSVLLEKEKAHILRNMAQGTPINRAAGGEARAVPTCFSSEKLSLVLMESTRCEEFAWSGKGGSGHLSAGHPGG